MKQCNRCSVEKVNSSFEFKTKTGKSIITKTCNDCRIVDGQYRKNLKNGIYGSKVLFRIQRIDALTRHNFICSSCKQELPISSFHKNSGSTREFGYSSSCRNCIYKLQRFARIRSKFKITNQELYALYDLQNGQCAICKKFLNIISSDNKRGKTACLDHCHETGKLRGLLCHSCNRAIGLLKDDLSIIEAAYKYLVLYKSGEFRGSPAEDNPEPSSLNNIIVNEKVQRIGDEKFINNSPTSAGHCKSDDVC